LVTLYLYQRERLMTDEKYLQPVDDGLPARPSNDYARYKLKALETYLQIAPTAVKNSNWRDMYFIDLQAGPGKNRIETEILLGSPLLSLSLKQPFTQYRFNDMDAKMVEALQTRVSASPLKDRVKIYNGDVNEVVDIVCDEIATRDKQFIKGMWSCFNVAFLDPEGLELHWDTVAKLARMKRMDLIINISTMGISRLEGVQQNERIDRFFGSTQWRDCNTRRELINLYRQQLEPFEYYIDENPELPFHDISFKNSKNSEVYRLIFASKHPLGDNFWRKAGGSIKPSQPTLL